MLVLLEKANRENGTTGLLGVLAPSDSLTLFQREGAYAGLDTKGKANNRGNLVV